MKNGNLSKKYHKFILKILKICSNKGNFTIVQEISVKLMIQGDNTKGLGGGGGVTRWKTNTILI